MGSLVVHSQPFFETCHPTNSTWYFLVPWRRRQLISLQLYGAEGVSALLLNFIVQDKQPSRKGSVHRPAAEGAYEGVTPRPHELLKKPEKPFKDQIEKEKRLGVFG